MALRAMNVVGHLPRTIAGKVIGDQLEITAIMVASRKTASR